MQTNFLQFSDKDNKKFYIFAPPNKINIMQTLKKRPEKRISLNFLISHLSLPDELTEFNSICPFATLSEDEVLSSCHNSELVFKRSLFYIFMRSKGASTNTLAIWLKKNHATIIRSTTFDRDYSYVSLRPRETEAFIHICAEQQKTVRKDLPFK